MPKAVDPRETPCELVVGGWRVPSGLGPLIPQVFGMASLDLLALATVGELFEGVGPCRPEQPIAGCRTFDISRDERFRDEARDARDDIGDGNLAARRDHARRLQREAAGKNGKAPQDHALGLREQLVAPVKDGP